MEICLIPDSLTSIASTPADLNFGFSKPFNPTPESFQISAAVAPPLVRSNRVKTLPRRLLKQRRRTKKRSSTGGDDDGEEVFGFYSDGGGGDGTFNNNGGGGAGGGGGGGGNWNFGWDEFFSDSNNNGGYHDPAFDFVYEVLSWIVLSNCLHFAFQKFARIARQKVQLRLGSVC